LGMEPTTRSLPMVEGLLAPEITSGHSKPSLASAWPRVSTGLAAAARSAVLLHGLLHPQLPQDAVQGWLQPIRCARLLLCVAPVARQSKWYEQAVLPLLPATKGWLRASTRGSGRKDLLHPSWDGWHLCSVPI